MQVRKGIYFKLKNFDRTAKEQRAVFYITIFPGVPGSHRLQWEGYSEEGGLELKKYGSKQSA